MKKSPISVAVIGDFRRKEFETVVRQIHEITAAIYFDHVSLFWDSNRPGQNFDLIFLLASGFSEYKSGDIRDMQRRFPLAKIVMVAGALSEGERRTGNLPPELPRYYWHQWETEVRPAFASFCDRRDSPWGLPHTASDEERLLAIATTLELAKANSDMLPETSQTQSALIVADDPAMRLLLADWASQNGFKNVSQHGTNLPPSAETVDADEILFDVASENFAETLAIVRTLKRHRPRSTRLTVFCTGPRPHEIEQLRQAGANRVLSKPFFLPR